MFKRPTKKQQLFRRIAVLTVMAVAVVVIVAGTILFILGYRIDGDKGRLEQGALVQFDSRPNGADVLIDGKSIRANTPSKQSIVAGAHSFTVTRDKYETWSKRLSVKAGTLQWLDYIRLVPKDLKTEAVASYATVVAEKSSPDNKWLLVQEKIDAPTFQLVDLRSQQIKSSTLSLTADMYSEAETADVAHSFAIESWDENGRYVLIKHTYADKIEHIVLDTQDVASSVNVSQLLIISLTEVEFSGTSGNILYGLSTDGTLRRLDLASATISRALVSNVKTFNLFDTDLISYIASDAKTPTIQLAGLYREGDTNAHVVARSTDADAPLHIAMTQYYNDDYVAISDGLKVTILKGRYPADSDVENSSLKQYAQFTAAANVDTLSFSKEGDFLVAQSGLAFVGYEIEYMRYTAGTIPTSETTSHTLNWLDNAYLWATYDGHLAIREFDGTNTHVIMNMEPGFDATLSQNGKYLYGMAKNADNSKYQLQRVQMILN